MLHKLINFLKNPIYWLILLLISSAATAKPIKIGIRSFNSIDLTNEQWKATTDYLSKEIEGVHFELIPIRSILALSDRVKNNEFDFIIATPSSYIEIEKKYGASRLLTLQNKRHGKPYTVFGSVIFTKKQRHDINKFSDLKGKRLMANSPLGFGGWMVAWGELLDNDFDPKTDLKELVFSSIQTQIDVVHSVINENVDVGVVRTDMLERLDEKKEIDISQLKIIGQKKTSGFPFLHSTQLYPEWAFVKAKNTSNKLAQKVAIALLKIEPNHIAAKQGRYFGWTVPLNYEPVRQLLKKLRISPYDKIEKLSLDQALVVYKRELFTTGSFFFIFIIMILYSINLNRRLNKRRKLIQEDKLKLQQEIEQRNNNIILLNSIGNAQSSYINTSNETLAFDALLNGLLEMTKSTLGSILRVSATEPTKYHTYSTLVQVENMTKQFQPTSNLININPFSEVFDHVMTSKKIKSLVYVFSDQDNIPKDYHVVLLENSFIQAIPILHKKEVICVVFLCQSSEFNSKSKLAELAPLFNTCINLITRFDAQKLAKKNEQALKESEAQQRTILDSMSEALFIIEDSGDISKCNFATVKLFGFTEDETIGKNINQLILNFPAVVDEYFVYKKLQEQNNHSIMIESMGKRKDGTTFPLLISLSEILINHRHYFAGFFRDITDLKRTSQLRREKEAAEMANKSKSEFLANMSHELRTPLHGILSFSSLGLLKFEKGEFKAIRDYLKHIHKSGDRLLNLIDNILDLSSVESGKTDLRLDHHNISALISQCITEMKPLANEKFIEFVFKDDNIIVHCDTTLIYQVIVNLLSNSIKFSPKDETIIINTSLDKISIGKNLVDAICIEISDNGVGIPKGEEDQIFDKFFQSSKTRTNAGGTGLGLSICLEFVKLHHGKISAKNRVQGGTTFTLLLPIEQIRKNL